MAETKSKPKCPLIDKKVKVYPIKRASGLVPDPEHEASFLFGTSTVKYTVPMTRTGSLVNPLTAEEKRYFEEVDDQLDFKEGDLSIPSESIRVNGSDDNYWLGFTVELDKNIRILDLNEPMDYIIYKVLIANKDHIAPSWEERNDKATFKYALVEEGEEQKAQATVANKKREAYKQFGKMESSPDEMLKFLKVYGKKVSENSTREFLEGEVSKVIEEDIDGFLDIVNDPHYDTKLLITNGLEVGALIKERSTYSLPGGEVIGKSLQETIDYLEDNKNQDVRLEIEHRIEKSK